MQKIEYSTIPFFNGSGSGHSQLPANSMDDHLAYGSIQSVAIKIFESQCLKGTGNMTSAAKVVLRTDEKKMEWPLCHFPTKCLGAQALHLQTLSIKMKDRVTEGTLELPQAMQANLLTYLAEGKPKIGFCCFDFVAYLYGFKRGYLGSFGLLPFSSEQLLPGDVVILAKGSGLTHAAIYLGNGLYLWHYGPTCLKVSSLEEMNQIYLSTQLFKGYPFSPEEQALLAIMPKLAQVARLPLSNFKSIEECRNWIEYHLTDLQKIVSLDLSFCYLSVLPPELYQFCRQIERLYLSDNLFTSLPSGISAFENLKSLCCSENQLMELPLELNALKKLETFHCAHNRLNKLLEGLFLDQVRYLDLTGNRLQDLSAIHKTFPRLTLLDLKANEVQELPPAFVELNQLVYLDLSNNRLKKLPENIDKLVGLKSMNVKNNELPKVPDTLFDLRELEVIDIRGNPLAKISNKVTALEQLYFLGLPKSMHDQTFNFRWKKISPEFG